MDFDYTRFARISQSLNVPGNIHLVYWSSEDGYENQRHILHTNPKLRAVVDYEYNDLHHATFTRTVGGFPHQTGTWALGTTFTLSAGTYTSGAIDVPDTAPIGTVDLVTFWVNTADGSYAISPIKHLTITP